MLIYGACQSSLDTQRAPSGLRYGYGGGGGGERFCQLMFRRASALRGEGFNASLVVFFIKNNNMRDATTTAAAAATITSRPSSPTHGFTASVGLTAGSCGGGEQKRRGKAVAKGNVALFLFSKLV